MKELRDIKFRFWIPSVKKMASWQEAKEQCDRLSIFSIGKNFIPMQFTGILDKKGVEIYEGDVLSPGYADGELFVVVFDETKGRFAEQRAMKDIPLSDVYIMDGSFLRQSKIEIIGNIYENPELIGEGN